MPREKEGYREQLARLDEKFPGREVLTLAEAQALLGDVYRTTILGDETFPVKKLSGKWIVPMVALARWLA